MNYIIFKEKFRYEHIFNKKHWSTFNADGLRTNTSTTRKANVSTDIAVKLHKNSRRISSDL